MLVVEFELGGLVTRSAASPARQAIRHARG
jgi:hypothetical protein